MTDLAAGPLAGTRIVELGGIGPGPFGAMLLADLGADVVRIDRLGAETLFPGQAKDNLLNRGKRSVAIDLKTSEGRAAATGLISRADALVEGFRPGVAERLGLGPDDCHEFNKRLVYVRMTGWGQTGPRARTAGHDINYIAVTGALHAMGEQGGPPQIPVNLLGDFGGGGTYLAIGLLAALRQADTTGQRTTVDVAIVDGVAHLMTGTHARMAAGSWEDRRGVNLLDGGAPFYAVYETADRRHMAVGALERPFFTDLVAILGVDVDPDSQNDRSTWPTLRAKIADRFRTKTMREWEELFTGTDACVSPVLSMHEALEEDQIRSRGSLIRHNRHVQASRALRFDAAGARAPGHPPEPGQHTAEVMADWEVAVTNDHEE